MASVDWPVLTWNGCGGLQPPGIALCLLRACCLLRVYWYTDEAWLPKMKLCSCNRWEAIVICHGPVCPLTRGATQGDLYIKA
jgi:hypothetical protein